MQSKQSASNWYLSDEKHFSSGIVENGSPSGNQHVFIKTEGERHREFGFLSKQVSAKPFIGKQLKMACMVKAELAENSQVQLWLRVDGEWETKRKDVFDNMYKSRIVESIDWTKFEVAVNVPEGSKNVIFGVLILGEGQTWLDDVVLETYEGKVTLAGR